MSVYFQELFENGNSLGIEIYLLDKIISFIQISEFYAGIKWR